MKLTTKRTLAILQAQVDLIGHEGSFRARILDFAGTPNDSPYILVDDQLAAKRIFVQKVLGKSLGQKEKCYGKGYTLKKGYEIIWEQLVRNHMSTR